MNAAADDFVACPLPPGFRADGCTVVRCKGDRARAFVRAPDGTVYTTSGLALHMARDWPINGSDCRAYARLRGIPLATLAAARKAAEVAQVRIDTARAVQQLRHDARQLGLRVVRARAVARKTRRRPE